MDNDFVVIRHAEPGDIDAIRRVARESWAGVYAGIIPPNVQSELLDAWYSAESLTQAIEAEMSVFLVAEVQGEVVGFAQVAHASSTLVSLTRIYLLPGEQHKGFGTRLIEAATTELADGVEWIEVDVEQENVRARRFYERLGFTVVRTKAEMAPGFTWTLVTYRKAVASGDRDGDHHHG